MPGELHQRVIKELYDRLAPTSIVWAITGSCSFALQGLAEAYEKMGRLETAAMLRQWLT